MASLDRIIRRVGDPMLARRIIRKILTRFRVGSYEARLAVGAFERPWYAWCLYYAATEAKALGYKAMTAIELGVAGGNGLLALCRYRDEVEREVGVKIIIYGLDAGTGLPASSDSRDILYCWPAGSFEMDQSKLERRLKGAAALIIGDVAKTVMEVPFAPSAPLGAVLFDLDLYTSTRDAFALFGRPVLPRVWCYFDDITGYPENVYSDYTGVRMAIREFNGERTQERHLSQAYVFKDQAPEEWHQRIWVYHFLAHPDYNRCLSDHKHTLNLT